MSIKCVNSNWPYHKNGFIAGHMASIEVCNILVKCHVTSKYMVIDQLSINTSLYTYLLRPNYHAYNIAYKRMNKAASCHDKLALCNLMA